VLLTGLPSSGKTTIAMATLNLVTAAGQDAEVLDGDDVRRRMWPELGLSRADRAENLSRLTTVAMLLAQHGVLVIVSAIAPYARDRDLMRARHLDAGLDFVEVHVATPLMVCQRRDVKGLYARRARGELAGLTGIDATYEEPAVPHLRIDTSGETVFESAGRVLDVLTIRGLVTAALTRQGMRS
jgi:adenylylsulfate kinase